MHVIRFLLLLILATTATSRLSADDKTSSQKTNVLFIAIDDLNHWVGHLGRKPQTRTPHLDRLAELGVTFTRANCAAPVCNPSRASSVVLTPPAREDVLGT